MFVPEFTIFCLIVSPLPEEKPDRLPELAEAVQEKVVVVAVRELGPTVRIGSPALVEGGTEVVLDLTAYESAKSMPRAFSVYWRNGGPGVVKGVATLPQDMQAALVAGLQPTKR